jgi:putative intracellular protease/amidase
MKLLMVLTSHDKLGTTGRKTGFWLEEFAAPYYTFKEAGVDIVIASPKGLRAHRRPADHRPESGLVGARRPGADRGPEQVGVGDAGMTPLSRGRYALP